MSQQRLVAFVLVIASLLLLSGQSTMVKPSAAPRITKDAPQTLAPFAPGVKKWVVHNVLASKKLLPCLPTVESLKAEDAGGFVCSRVVVVNLHVDQNGVQTSPDHFVVEQGDCLMWQVQKAPGDTTTAGINLINFFDTAAEIPAGKNVQPNAKAIGYDFCKRNRPQCVLGVALDPGTYNYEARVKYGDAIKATDPGGEVQCSGCGGPPSNSDF